MDDYSSKRASDGLVVSRRGSALVLRDTANNRDQNAQFCNRIGCNGRMNTTKGTQISCSEKAKSSKASYRPSSSGKEIIGNSSRTFSAISKPRKSFPEPRKKLSSQLDTDSFETRSVQDKPEVLECEPPPGKFRRGICPCFDEAGSSEITSLEVGSSSVTTSRRSRGNFHQTSGLSNPDNLVSSSSSLASRSSGQGTRTSASRYGLRNLRYNSVSDVVPSGPSSSDSNMNRRKDVAKKRICDGESSSSMRGKKMSGLSLEGRNSSCKPGISISDSRRTTIGPPNRDNVAASVRTRRSLNGYTGPRLTNRGSGNNLSPNECPATTPQMSQPDIPFDLNAISSHQFAVEATLSCPSSSSRPGISSESLWGIRPSSPAEVGNSRTSTNRDSFRRYNIDGIAEVLLALERIEQDEELTYEELLVLETNLFLNGLNFYDQHRDLRLDIDNMSYEELLALEERMGTVSTALTEEALSECLKTSIYQLAPLEAATMDVGEDGDDVKCSICQEEYAVGDEVGRLQCGHRYHVGCIHQWLRQKNWCPTCKASAVAASSPTCL